MGHGSNVMAHSYWREMFAIFDSDLKISFYLQIGDEFWSERMIAERLEQVREMAKRQKYQKIPSGATGRYKFHPETLDGAISIVYLGKELLGVDFADGVRHFYIWQNQLLLGKELSVDLYYAGTRLRLVPSGDELIFRVESTSPLRVLKADQETILPLELFVREWTTMGFRFGRLMAWLGARSGEQIIYGWEKYMSPRWQEIMGEGRMMKLCEADLYDLLHETDGPYGYRGLYENDKFHFLPIEADQK